MSSESPRPKRTRYSNRNSGDNATNSRSNALSDDQYLNKYRHLREETSKSKETLKIDTIDLQVEVNRKAHHTDEYDQKNLIVRRGSPFTLTLKFHRKVIKEIDNVILQFSVGNKPLETKGSLIRLKLFQDLRPSVKNIVKRANWGFKCLSCKGSTIEVEITPLVNSPIGSYKLYVETKNADELDDEVERYLHIEKFIVLFNPWCETDTVYMEDEKLLEEYILNESGRIWVGSANDNRARPWNFGQFQEPCLDTALLLLDKGGLSTLSKKDPVAVIRCLTAMTNSNDDNGLITGRWTSDYPQPCTRPLAWCGSVEIIKEYSESLKPVKYGQCWVFSGLLTTLLRTLGIPTRSVTNFQSAHDTNGSITIDKYLNELFDSVSDLDDSVWNFHVWNESWLKRPDLPAGYDGWQAHDSTPQETSDGLMRCGPSPLKAIKEGDVYINYDSPFIFSEVNGDKVFWKINSNNGDVVPFHIDEKAVGKCISTKAVGSLEREDLTDNYKYKEGTKEERRAVEKACQCNNSAKEIYGVEKSDVDFEIVEIKKAILGNSFTFGLKIHAKETLRTVNTSFAVMTCFYTGVTEKRILSQKDKVVVKPEEDKTVKITVEPEAYEEKINPDGVMSILVVANVEETLQNYVYERPIILKKPDLTLTCSDDIRQGDMFDLTIKFINPMKTELKNLIYHIEGAAIRKACTIEEETIVKPDAEVTKVVELYAYKYGARELIVTLSSDRLDDVDGTIVIYAKYPA